MPDDLNSMSANNRGSSSVAQGFNTPLASKRLVPKDLKRADFKNIDYEHVFYNSLEKVATLDMYTQFLKTGWTTELIVETREILIPEIVRVITLNWAAAIQACEREREKEHF